MVREIDRDSLSAEQQYELDAAFGPDTTVVTLEESDLEPVDEPHPADQVDFERLNEGDVITVRFMSGTVYEGVIKNSREYSFSTDPVDDDGVPKIMSYRDFLGSKDEPGITHEMLNIERSEA